MPAPTSNVSHPTPDPTDATVRPFERGGRRRWIVLAMLFIASFLNYFDRQTLSVLKPTIKMEFGLTDAHYSVLVTAFMAPYIVMYILGGRFVDKVGARFSMALFVGVWSLATAATGFVRSVWQLGACRFVLGVAEPGNWSGGVRALAGLFSAGERGLAISIIQAGSAIGSMVAPPLIAFMALSYGWRSAFWIPGVLGLLWVAAWYACYRPADDAVPADQPAAPRWRDLMRRREFWGLVLARSVSDPVWYFYLFWVPGYLQEKVGLSLAAAGAVGWIPFLFADVWGIGSSALADKFVRNGTPPLVARKRVLFAMACVGPLGALAPHMVAVPAILAIFSLACAMCLTWTFNTSTVVADIFPRNATGSVIGVMGAAGATGGLLFNAYIGGVVESVGYAPVFAVTGLLHPLAAIIFAVLLRPAKPTAR